MDKAIAEFQQAVELDPRYVLAYARLAEAYARKYYQSRAPEALDLARRNAQRATELNRNAAPAWVSAAMASSAGGQYQNALEAYGHALKLDPANVEALFGRALSLSRLGRPAEAEAAYQRVLEVRPNYWRGYNQFGTFYYQNADYVKAEQMFRYAMEAAPAIALPYTNLGGVYLASGKYLEAAAMFRKSLELGPSAEAYANLGTALVFQGQAAEAARMMEKAVEINPRSHVLWRNLGDAYRSAPELRSRAPQAYRQAVALAGQQLQVSPQDASTLMSLSLYWAKLEDASQARKYLEAAGRSPSGDLNLAFKRALVLELIGARERALAELRELAGRGFALDQIRKAPELEELRKDPRFSSVLAAGR
jgi:serine/threonine-protein kinase